MRFLKRYLSMKHHSTLMTSLMCVFLSLFAIRTPWIESHVEALLIESTGHVFSLWDQLKERLHNVKVLYAPAESQQELIIRLEKENAWLRHQALEMASLRQEKASLEKILHVVRHQKLQNFRTAPVLTNPLNGWNRMFLIGAGRRHGIKRGQPVISIDGIVGRIDSVSPHFSRVMPITHQHFRIPVIGLKSHAQAILAGNGSKNPSLIYLEDAHTIRRTETFVSSLHGGGFPQGHFVGQLSYNKENQPSFQTFIPWGRLEFVHILLDFPLLEGKEGQEPHRQKKPTSAESKGDSR